MAKKIAFIGAGSFGFTRGLVRDILSFEAFRDAEIALMDINKERLSFIEKAVKKQPALKTIPALGNHRVWPLPFYCGALAWREPLILQVWKEALCAV